MLKQMRENTKPVLWIVLVGFLGGFVLIALGTGSGGFGDLVRSLGIKVSTASSNMGAVINNIPISREQFQREYRSQREAEQQRLGEAFAEDERTHQQLRERTWNVLLQRLLVFSETKKLGIGVTSRELAEFLVSNPPQWIMEHPQLQTDGHFDMQKYVQVLQSPEGPAQMLQATYAEMLPLHKLERRIVMCTRVTSLEVEREMDAQAERVKATCLALKDFHFTQATDEDKERVRQLGLELMTQATSPGKFAKLAKRYSSGAKAQEGGRVGKTFKGGRGAAVDSVLFSQDLGTCSQPVERFGSWFLYFVHERGEEDEKEWVDFSQIVLNVMLPVDEAELKRYFNEHISEYDIPAKAKTKIVKLEKKASARDEADMLADIRSIREEIIGGKSFEEAAQIESEDVGSAEQGGDLGEFGRGRMVKEFEDVAFALQPGELSEPVRTQFGWHIILVEEKKTGEDGKALIRARHILLKVEPERATLDSLDNVMVDIAEQAKEVGLEQAAEKQGLQVTETELFTKGPYIPGVGPTASGAGWIFSRRVGDISDPFETEKEFFILQSTEKQEERHATLDEVRGRVVRAVLKEKATQLAEDYLADLGNRIANGETLEQVAESDTLAELLSDVQLGRKDYAPGIGREVEAIGAPFGITKGEVAGPFAAGQAFVMARRDSSWTLEETESREKVVEYLQNEARQRVYGAWFTWLKDKAIIEDNRERFFGVS